MKKEQHILGWLVPYVVLCPAIIGCGTGNTVGCDFSIGNSHAVLNSENNYQCPVGEILVGYNPNAVGGPLLCATQTVACPVPGK